MRQTDPPEDPGDEIPALRHTDARTFFSSFYRVTVKGLVADSMTIGTVSEPEARFHYNASENSIIRGLAKIAPVGTQAPAVWQFAQARRAWQVLDVGSGTGHWVDFYLHVYLAKSVTAVEFVPQMAEILRQKYRERPEVSVVQADIANDPLPENTFDVVNAIGVLFHIIDDAALERTVAKLLAALAPAGLLLIGGDFGAATRDVQFHRVDNFDSWKEHDRSGAPANLVNKRVRSLAFWTSLCGRLGASVFDLIRSDADPLIRTPENDLLILRRDPEFTRRPDAS